MPQKKIPQTVRDLHSSSSERVLLGKSVKLSNSPIVSIKKHGNHRILVFDNGQKKMISKAELRKMVNDEIAVTQASAMALTMRPTGKGKKVKMRIGGFVKGVERTFSSRERAQQVLKERYGLEGDRGTRFSKASRFGKGLEAVRAHLRGLRKEQGKFA